MHNLLELFDRESTESLEKIRECFVALYHKYLLKMLPLRYGHLLLNRQKNVSMSIQCWLNSLIRLDAIFNGIRFERHDENQLSSNSDNRFFLTGKFYEQIFFICIFYFILKFNMLRRKLVAIED